MFEKDFADFKKNCEEIVTNEKDEERTKKILDLSDRMLEKISVAIDELSFSEIKEKKRIKEVEYDSEINKPVRETNTELEVSERKESLIDTSSLKQLVSTLKDIKDIHQSFCLSNDGEESESGVILLSDIEEEKEE